MHDYLTMSQPHHVVVFPFIYVKKQIMTQYELLIQQEHHSCAMYVLWHNYNESLDVCDRVLCDKLTMWPSVTALAVCSITHLCSNTSNNINSSHTGTTSVLCNVCAMAQLGLLLV